MNNRVLDQAVFVLLRKENSPTTACMWFDTVPEAASGSYATQFDAGSQHGTSLADPLSFRFA